MEKRALTETEKVMLIKLLMGGAMAGGAAGLATSYGNQIKTLRDEAKRTNDDPIVNLPALPENAYAVKAAGGDKPAAPVDHTDKPPGIMALALALPAIGLPALYTYAAARKAHQMYKKEELKKEVGDSEEAYLEALQKTAEEKSIYANPQGRPFLPMENWGMLTAGVIPLSGLAAAYMTNKILDKSFPVAKKPRTPRRIRIRRQDPQRPAEANDSETAEYDEPADDEDTPIDVEAEEVKEASYYDLDESDAVEFLVRTVLGNPKVAAVSQLPDLILNGSVDYTQTSNTFMFRGVEAGFNHVKSASRTSWADSLDRAAGIHLMVKSASLGPSVALLAAAEFAEAHPMMCSQAALIDPRVGEELIKFAALHGATTRAVDVEKFLAESGEEDFSKTAADHTAVVAYTQLGRLCQEKRAFVGGKEKLDEGDATWAGGLGGILGFPGAAAVSGIHSGVESDSFGAGGRSALGAGTGSAVGGGAGLLLSGLLAKSMMGQHAEGREFGNVEAIKAILAGTLPVAGSVAGGALGSRWAAKKHNSKVDEMDGRQAAIISGLVNGRHPGESEEEKQASAKARVLSALLNGAIGAAAFPTLHYGFGSLTGMGDRLPKTPEDVGPYMALNALKGGLLGASTGAFNPHEMFDEEPKEEEKSAAKKEKKTKVEIPDYEDWTDEMVLKDPDGALAAAEVAFERDKQRGGYIIRDESNFEDDEEEKAAGADKRDMVPTHSAINISKSRSSQVAETENSRGDDPIVEESEEEDIVDQAMTELAGVN